MPVNSSSGRILRFSLPSFLGQVLFGHRPIEADVIPDHFDRAIDVRRPDVSQVYYAALEVERPQAWFRFEGEPPRRVEAGMKPIE